MPAAACDPLCTRRNKAEESQAARPWCSPSQPLTVSYKRACAACYRITYECRLAARDTRLKRSYFVHRQKDPTTCATLSKTCSAVRKTTMVAKLYHVSLVEASSFGEPTKMSRTVEYPCDHGTEPIRSKVWLPRDAPPRSQYEPRDEGTYPVSSQRTHCSSIWPVEGHTQSCVLVGPSSRLTYGAY